MSDTNTNNDAINSKKKHNINEPHVGNFILYYSLGMLGIILWVLFGTAWLYISKLVTSGIPSDTKYEPYSCEINTKLGKNLENDESKKVSMNSIHQLGMKGLAFWQMWSNDSPANKWQQEATFDTQEFLASFDGSLIQEFRDSANIRGTGSAAATGFDKFCSIVLNNVAARGFKWYDTFSLSDKLNDSFKIFIYGLFGLILFPIIWVLNGMCSFYYLCKAVFIPEKPDNINNGGANDILGFIIKLTNSDESGPGGVKNWFKYIGRGFIWLIFWLLIFPILSFFVCPLYATFMPFFKLLWSGSYSLKVDNKFYDSEQSDTKSFWDFIKDTFAYKRTFLLFLAILNLFTCANTYLGKMYFGAVCLAVVLAIVFGDIFVNTAPNDNTMILQQNEYKPKLPKSRRQPIHKGCMFPQQIKQIDETLHNLNKELTLLIQESQSVLPNPEIEGFISKLTEMRAKLNEEFTVISMSEVEADVDNFGKKVADKYASKIEELKGKIKESIEKKAAKEAEEKAAKEKEAKEAAENKEVIENIKDILKNVSTKIDNIYKNLKNNVGPLGSEKYDNYLTKANDYKTQLSELKESVAKSDNKEDSNKILADCKILNTEVTTFETDLDSEITSLDTSGSGLDTGFGLSATDASSLDTSGSATGSETGSETDSETDRPSNISSSSSILSNISSSPMVDIDRDNLITYVNDRNKSSILEENMNLMSSAGVGSANRNISETLVKNTIAPDTNKLTIDPSNQSNPDLAKQRAKDSASSNDTRNPMIEMTNFGTSGQKMKSIDVKEVNAVPMSNPVLKSPELSSEKIKERTAESESSGTTTNAIHAQPSANAGQKIGGSLTPGILSDKGRLLTLTIPGKDQLKLKIGDCIEFTKNYKKQSGNIVDFYKSNSETNIVDIIFIDLFDKNQGKFIAKTVKETGAQEKNVLGELNNPFIGGDTDESRNKILVDYPNYRPDGITLTSVFSSQYNDANVWKTISKCSTDSDAFKASQNALGEQIIADDRAGQSQKDATIDMLNAELRKEGVDSNAMTEGKKRIKEAEYEANAALLSNNSFNPVVPNDSYLKGKGLSINNNNRNNNNNNNNYDFSGYIRDLQGPNSKWGKSGGSKSKTLKKKQQNIKIRLV
jgi:hypothetical protein